MVPAPTPEHERLVISIGARLFAAIEELGLGRVYGSPAIDGGLTTLRPDAVVVLKANLGVVATQRLVGPPDLVVEITSPSTAAYDRDPVEVKRGAYAYMGVPEYWLVDPATRTVEVLVLDGASYRALGAFHGDEPVRSQVIPGDTLLAGRLFPRED